MVEGGMAGRCEHTGGGRKKNKVPFCCVFNIPRLIYLIFSLKQKTTARKVKVQMEKVVVKRVGERWRTCRERVTKG